MILMQNHSVGFRHLLAGFVIVAFMLSIAFTSVHAQTTVTGTISSSNFPCAISQPGLYVVTGPLTTTASSGALIAIYTSNVTIDFQGYSISGAADNAAQSSVGVFIWDNGAPQQNITIQNGTIQNCCFGIQIAGSGGTSAPSINSVRIDNMRVTNCSQYGIYGLGATACLINNCQIFNIGLTTSTINTCGIFFGGINSTIQGCTVNTILTGANYASSCINTTNQCAVRQNQVGSASFGLLGGGVYQDNLASGFTNSNENAFVPGYTDGGGNVANSQ